MPPIPISPSQPPESILGSRVPPARADATSDVESDLRRLRAECAATTDGARKARLFYEIGEIEERAGEETAAARDYLAAYNADGRFREPVEGLLRLLLRRRSHRNLGKIVDALARMADTPDERARAHVLRAFFYEDIGADLDAALKAAVEASESEGASRDESAAAWLALEMLAAESGDAEARARALAERPAFADDPTWRALLLLDVASEAARKGDFDEAGARLTQARTDAAGASYTVAVALERLAARRDDEADGEAPAAAARMYAEALEAQASLIEEAIASPARGDALGVPRWARAPTRMIDAWVRAAETRATRLNDPPAAAALLDRVRATAEVFEHQDPSMLAALVDARIRIAERMGDTALAAQLAESRLGDDASDGAARGALREEDGGAAAALAMRVAEHATSEGDPARALRAASTALARDPGCIPARALQIDLLGDDDPGVFAAQLEAWADELPTEPARARVLLLAAWIWGARARDAAAARAALFQAGVAGASPTVVARLGRALASLTGDGAWYDESLRRLITSLGEGDDADRASLMFELVRLRFARGDDAGARRSLRDLGALESGAWLARALEAFLPATGDSAERAREALDELALRPQAHDVARGLTLMAALRSHRAGDAEGARRRLHDLLAQRPDDVLAATYLAEAERANGAIDEVARVVEACANAVDDPELAAEQWIESSLLRWSLDDREGALGALERAARSAPEAARTALAWVARGAGVDDLAARGRAIGYAEETDSEDGPLLLERFAVDVAARDDVGAKSALDALEAGGDASLVLSASLARLAWAAGDADTELDSAIARVGSRGPEAATFAAGETFRRAREHGASDATVEAAQAWFKSGGDVTAALEWLAASMANKSPQAEAAARRALAEVLPSELREPLLASAAMLELVADPLKSGPLLVGESPAVRLLNLELAPPGSDPRRRIAALTGLDEIIGPDAHADAASLAGWSWLVEGNAAEATLAFEDAVTVHADDIGAWEGLRAASLATGDLGKRASACEALGALCRDDARSALFWEEAGRTWLEASEEARAENAFDAAFTRDPHRAFAFDKVFRKLRERREGERLLDVIGRRLAVSDDPPEIAKLFWEQARVLRERGDQEAALKALENVTMLEPDHVGALALTGEIAIKRGHFEEAANALARLALLDEAPGKNRVTAGIAAVDLFENKLNRFDRALEILLGLHRAKLSTLPVRERLARAAARTGSWKEATEILEVLMRERPETEGRVEAARLAMAIHRDRLHRLDGAKDAVVKLLEESPADGEGLDVLFSLDLEPPVKARLLEAARVALVDSLQRRPIDLPAAKRLAKVARAQGDDALQQIALSVATVLAGHDAALEQQFSAIAAKKPRIPQIALSEAVIKQILDPGDRGPVARLFTALGPTLAEALGPSLVACGVSKRDRVDPRAGIALRNEIAAWAGAFGITEFDLYIGGKDPLGVQGVPGEPPAIVVGAGVNAPLAPATRARVARELLGMVRGSTIVRHRDETTIAAVVVAACNLAEVRVDSPSYAVLADVEKQLAKAIARKTKKALPDLCQAIVASSADARAWSKRALASHARVATIACGDVGVALTDALGEPPDALATAMKGDPRAEELLRFATSPVYVEIRRALGLDGPMGSSTSVRPPASMHPPASIRPPPKGGAS